MILETERLLIRELTVKDAPFFLELVNDKDWKRFIGDRNVHSLKDAENYLSEKIMTSYDDWGFGFYLVIEKEVSQPIGISGFVKRDELEYVDVGFAFLPLGRGKGYAYEATKTLMDYGINELKFSTILAIANNDNIRSHQLLQKLGFTFTKYIKLDDEDEEISLFSMIQ